MLQAACMRIFVTGASGWVGSAVTRDLVAHGHSVLGFARSAAGAKVVADAGGDVHRGSLEDLDSLRTGTQACEGVVHCAFIHDFTQFEANCRADAAAIEAIGTVLGDKPLITTSGTLGLARGRLGTEDDIAEPGPRKSEALALDLAKRGMRAMTVRLSPSVHGTGDHGFMAILIRHAREKGYALYVGDGANRWPAVHRFDAAPIYRLALERGTAGSRWHGVADEGVQLRQVAELIGRKLGVPAVAKTPQEATAELGFIGMVLGADVPASNALTRERLGWKPTGPSLLEDLEQHYFA